MTSDQQSKKLFKKQMEINLGEIGAPRVTKIQIFKNASKYKNYFF